MKSGKAVVGSEIICFLLLNSVLTDAFNAKIYGFQLVRIRRNALETFFLHVFCAVRVLLSFPGWVTHARFDCWFITVNHEITGKLRVLRTSSSKMKHMKTVAQRIELSVLVLCTDSNWNGTHSASIGRSTSFRQLFLWTHLARRWGRRKNDATITFYFLQTPRACCVAGPFEAHPQSMLHSYG